MAIARKGAVQAVQVVQVVEMLGAGEGNALLLGGSERVSSTTGI